MNNQLHLGAQYLAMAGKSFLKHKNDDSHTNLAFFQENQSFETWPLDDAGLKLLFDLPNFQLKWSTGESLTLEGKTHAQILQWLQSSVKQLELQNPYHFNLHYVLPFKWDNSFVFNVKNSRELGRLVSLRTLANNVLNTFLKVEKLQSDIRIWPHHFDTGAFVVLEDGSGKSIGLGLAIPDSLVNDHYFYISGYKGHDGIDTSSFKQLNFGEWKNQGFKGAVLPTNGISADDAIHFLRDAFKAYTS